MIYYPETTLSDYLEYKGFRWFMTNTTYYQSIGMTLQPNHGDIFPCVVTLNGETFKSEIAYDANGAGFIIGNRSMSPSELFDMADNGQPFIIGVSSDGTNVGVQEELESCTFSVEEAVPDTEPDTATYRWKVKDNALVSIGKNDNPITTLEGGIVDGVFNNARYQLATPFDLLHDKDWAVEWRMSGDVTQDAGMAKIWDESGKQTDKASESVVFRKTSNSISLTSYSGSHIHHGVKLNDYGIDHTAEHLYRLQNKINADGTNMVWLYVDGVEVAPMRDTFDSSTQTGLTDWVVGKDFSFGYMGTPRYIMTGFIMDDIAVWESGASEIFPEEQPEMSWSPMSLLMGMQLGKIIARNRKPS